MSKFIILSISSKNYNDETLTGGHRRYGELVRCLAENGNRVYLIGPSLTPDTEPDSVVWFPISESRYESNLVPNTLVHSIKVLRCALRNLHGKRIDTIFVLGTSNGLPAIFLKPFLHCKLITMLLEDPQGYRALKVEEGGIKLIGSFRTKNKISQRTYLWLFGVFERLVLSHSDTIVVQSETYRRILSRRYADTRLDLKVLPANVNTSWMAKESENVNSSTKARRLCFAGSIQRRKGLSFLLEAFRILARKNAEISLDILGVGPLLDEMRHRLSGDVSMQSRVIFHGWVSHPQKIIALSDLLIVPSLDDSFPEVISEALYVGTPVIGSRVGGIPEQLRYDQLLFEPRSTEALLDKLQPIIEREETYIKIRKLCALRRQALTFDWGTEMQAILEGAMADREA